MQLSENGWANVRKAGVGLLVLACAATYAAARAPWAGWAALGLFAAVGAVDIILGAAKRKTISQKIYAMFPQWADYAILGGLMVLAWATWGPTGWLPVLMGVVFGHLFMHGD